MKVTTLILGKLGANCYIAMDDHHIGTVIDPGGNLEDLMETIQRKSIDVQAIILTHGHFDHMMAAAQLSENTKAPVYIHSLDQEMLKNPEPSLYTRVLSDEPFVPVSSAQLLKEEEVLKVGDMAFQILHTPGHSPGSVCLICDDVLFSGDTLFASSIGRSDFPGGDMNQLMRSLEKIKALDKDYTIYPGHGKPTSLEVERNQNLYLAGMEQI